MSPLEVTDDIEHTLFLHWWEEWDAAPLRAEAGPVPATAAGVAVLLPRLALHSLKGNIASSAANRSNRLYNHGEGPY